MRTAHVAFLALALLLAACGDAEEPHCTPVAPRTDPAPDTPTPTQPSPDPLLTRLQAQLHERGITKQPLAVWRRTEAGTSAFFKVPAKQAVETWQQLRALAEELRHYPVIVVGAPAELQEHLEPDEPKPGATIAKAAEQPAAAWMRAVLCEDPDFHGAIGEGTWVDKKPSDTLSVSLLGRGNVDLVLVPTPRPWEAITWLGYGGWNACPLPPAQVAMHKSWHERFGAELVSVERDTLEMRVSRPPTTREAAMTVAREQALYCPDNMFAFKGWRQFASELLGAKVWVFWWD